MNFKKRFTEGGVFKLGYASCVWVDVVIAVDILIKMILWLFVVDIHADVVGAAMAFGVYGSVLMSAFVSLLLL